ncbi:E3 ubiquitin-protein ligase, partial [Clarias magur]
MTVSKACDAAVKFQHFPRSDPTAPGNRAEATPCFPHNAPPSEHQSHAHCPGEPPRHFSLLRPRAQQCDAILDQSERQEKQDTPLYFLFLFFPHVSDCHSLSFRERTPPRPQGQRPEPENRG